MSTHPTHELLVHLSQLVQDLGILSSNSSRELAHIAELAFGAHVRLTEPQEELNSRYDRLQSVVDREFLMAVPPGIDAELKGEIEVLLGNLRNAMGHMHLLTSSVSDIWNQTEKDIVNVLSGWSIDDHHKRAETRLVNQFGSRSIGLKGTLEALETGDLDNSLAQYIRNNLTWRDCTAICGFYIHGRTQQSLADLLGITQAAVSQVISRELGTLEIVASLGEVIPRLDSLGLKLKPDLPSWVQKFRGSDDLMWLEREDGVPVVGLRVLNPKNEFPELNVDDDFISDGVGGGIILVIPGNDEHWDNAQEESSPGDYGDYSQFVKLFEWRSPPDRVKVRHNVIGINPESPPIQAPDVRLHYLQLCFWADGSISLHPPWFLDAEFDDLGAHAFWDGDIFSSFSDPVGLEDALRIYAKPSAEITEEPGGPY